MHFQKLFLISLSFVSFIFAFFNSLLLYWLNLLLFDFIVGYFRPHILFVFRCRPVYPVPNAFTIFIILFKCEKFFFFTAHEHYRVWYCLLLAKFIRDQLLSDFFLLLLEARASEGHYNMYIYMQIQSYFYSLYITHTANSQQ